VSARNEISSHFGQAQGLPLQLFASQALALHPESSHDAPPKIVHEESILARTIGVLPPLEPPADPASTQKYRASPDLHEAIWSCLRTLKAALYRLADATGLMNWLMKTGWRQKRLLILGYHGVEDDRGVLHRWLPGLYMTKSQLEDRFKILKETGCHVLALGEALAHLKEGTLPAGSVALTFDDGYYDFPGVVLPLLKKYGFPATLYLTTHHSEFNRPFFDTLCLYLFRRTDQKNISFNGLLGLDETLDLRTSSDREKAAGRVIDRAQKQRLDSKGEDAIASQVAQLLGFNYADILRDRLLHLMSPEEAQALADQGVNFQIHTHNHRVPEDRESFRDEISANRERLPRSAGNPLAHFCYPKGQTNPAFLPWLVQMGIQSAVTCVPGLAGPLSEFLLLPRFLDSASFSNTVFKAWVSGFAALLPRRPLYRIPKFPRPDGAGSAPAETVGSKIPEALSAAAIPQPPITVQTLDEKEFDGIREEWNGLLNRSASDNLFLRWEWIHAWWKTYQRSRTLVIVAVRDQGRLVGIAPFYAERKGPLGVRILRLAGEDLSPDYMDVITEKGHEKDVIDAVSRFLVRHAGEWDALLFNNILPESLVFKHLAHLNGFSMETREADPCPYISMTGPYEHYRQTHRTYLKRFSLERKFRAFQRCGGKYVTVRDTQDLSGRLDELMRLHAARADDKNMHSNFISPEGRRFVQALCPGLIEQGILNFQLLYLDERPIAALFAFNYGGKVYYYQNGFDPAFGRWSPGLLLILLAVKKAFADGMEFDFLKGREGYKYDWADAERQEMRLVVYNRTWRGRLYHSMMNLKSILRRVKLLRKIKNAVDRRRSRHVKNYQPEPNIDDGPALLFHERGEEGAHAVNGPHIVDLHH